MLLTLAAAASAFDRTSPLDEIGGKIASALKSMNSEWRDENLNGSSVVLLSLGETI